MHNEKGRIVKSSEDHLGNAGAFALLAIVFWGLFLCGLRTGRAEVTVNIAADRATNPGLFWGFQAVLAVFALTTTIASMIELWFTL